MTKVPQCELIRRLCSVRAMVVVAVIALVTVALVTLQVALRAEAPSDSPLDNHDGTAEEQQEALVEDLISAGIQSNIRKKFRFRVVNQRGQSVPGVAIVGAGDIKRVDCEMRRGRISAALPEV